MEAPARPTTKPMLDPLEAEWENLEASDGLASNSGEEEWEKIDDSSQQPLPEGISVFSSTLTYLRFTLYLARR